MVPAIQAALYMNVNHKARLLPRPPASGASESCWQGSDGALRRPRDRGRSILGIEILYLFESMVPSMAHKLRVQYPGATYHPPSQ